MTFFLGQVLSTWVTRQNLLKYQECTSKLMFLTMLWSSRNYSLSYSTYRYCFDMHRDIPLRLFALFVQLIYMYILLFYLTISQKLLFLGGNFLIQYSCSNGTHNEPTYNYRLFQEINGYTYTNIIINFEELSFCILIILEN